MSSLCRHPTHPNMHTKGPFNIDTPWSMGPLVSWVALGWSTTGQKHLCSTLQVWSTGGMYSFVSLEYQRVLEVLYILEYQRIPELFNVWMVMNMEKG